MGDGKGGGASEAAELTGCDVMREFMEHSPFGKHLGYELETIETDRAVLKMPYAPELATAGDLVHGGAVASLIDTAATAAAWARDEVADGARSSTVGMTVNYLAPANGQDLTAESRVLRRGRSIVHCDVEVRDPEGAAVAHGVVIYKLG